MRRPSAGLLIALPLAGAGSLTAHAVAYRVHEPEAVERAALLTRTGHGYLDYLPFALAVLGALLAAGLAARLVRALHGGTPGPVSAWPVALLAPVTFALQEHLERFASGLDLSWVALEPTFVLGLALQLPFAAAALVAARTLARAAEAVGESLSREPAPSAGRLPETRHAPQTSRSPTLALLASGHGSRAPPS